MEPLAEAFETFRRAYPAFASTDAAESWRAREFRRFDESGQVYLDYTGAAPYAECHVRRHAELLCREILGNPHSGSPASRRATELVDEARDRVLRFFNAPRDEYTLVFTANASQALKLVGESYPFDARGCFLLTFDNHNSVIGIREFARARGAKATYVPVHPPEMRSPAAEVKRALENRRPGCADQLFAYPAQSNFSGVQHPLEWIQMARDRGWDVLLDAAAFAPTNRLDLGRWRPDFVTVSFYKMFGYPTGVGALIARHGALQKLHRPWFSGGTITVASVTADRHFLESGAAAFEDGTVDYANLPAVAAGLDLLDEVGLETIHQRVSCLSGWLLERLLALRHRTGEPLIALYGPRTVEARGATITMNFRHPAGRLRDHTEIERRAAERGISLRTGCFCNPGAGEMALGLTADELTYCFRQARPHMTRDEFRQCIDAKGSGAVRVSLGYASTFSDVYAFVRFAEDLVE